MSQASDVCMALKTLSQYLHLWSSVNQVTLDKTALHSSMHLSAGPIIIPINESGYLTIFRQCIGIHMTVAWSWLSLHSRTSDVQAQLGSSTPALAWLSTARAQLRLRPRLAIGVVTMWHDISTWYEQRACLASKKSSFEKLRNKALNMSSEVQLTWSDVLQSKETLLCYW